MSLDSDLIYREFNLKAANSNNNNTYEFEGYRLDAEHRMLYNGSNEVVLAPKAIETLLVLVARRNEIVSKDELMKLIWTDAVVEESNLAQYLHVLRKTLGNRDNGKPFIETLRRRGYRFSADVRIVDTDNESLATFASTNTSRTLPSSGEVTHAYQIERQGNVLAVAEWNRPDTVTGESKIETDSVQDSAIEFPAAITSSSRRNWTRHFGVFLLIAAVVLGTFMLVRFGMPVTNEPIRSVAVLPFVNDGSDPNLNYLLDGLGENLIDRLSDLPQLKVIARNSSFAYRDPNIDLREVAQKLGVQAIVTGRVIRRGDELAIRVELIDANQNNQLWGGQFDGNIADALKIQREIASTVSDKLRLRLSATDTERLAKVNTNNSAAYENYLQGRFFQFKSTPKDLFKSIEFYRQAIALDKTFALAYVGLAESAGRLAHFRDIPQQEDYRQIARENVFKAVDLDDNLPEAHSALGSLLSMYDYDFAGAEREYSRAIELNPNYSEAHVWRGQLLSSLGIHDEALAEIQRGIDLDPVSLEANQAYGQALFFARRYDESIGYLKKILSLDAGYFPAHRFLAFNYEMKGDYDQRIAEMIEINSIGGTRERSQSITESYKRGGWPGFLKDAAENKFDLHPYLVATFCAEFGNKEKALAILETLYNQRSSDLVVIKVDPRLDNLRDDERFQDLIRRVGLAP